ncbi:VOC family protein [Allokutzneria albata]|uniref:VOC family protein n=1 Tax=Allokutzneria albata TaxID=211114 RepID=UPI003898E73B
MKVINAAFYSRQTFAHTAGTNRIRTTAQPIPGTIITFRVTDLDRSLAFYEGVLGFAVDQSRECKRRFRISLAVRLVQHPRRFPAHRAAGVATKGIQGSPSPEH